MRPQIQLAGDGPLLFPSNTDPSRHQTSFKTARRSNTASGGNPSSAFTTCALHTQRLSAARVADERVTQLFRRGDAKMFKKVFAGGTRGAAYDQGRSNDADSPN